MQRRSPNIHHLPTALYELKEASKLVREWGQIQKIHNDEERVVALVKWRDRMSSHLTNFNG